MVRSGCDRAVVASTGLWVDVTTKANVRNHAQDCVTQTRTTINVVTVFTARLIQTVMYLKMISIQSNPIGLSMPRLGGAVFQTIDDDSLMNRGGV